MFLIVFAKGVHLVVQICSKQEISIFSITELCDTSNYLRKFLCSRILRDVNHMTSLRCISHDKFLREITSLNRNTPFSSQNKCFSS